MAEAVEHDDPCACNFAAEAARVVDGNELVRATPEHERGHADCLQPVERFSGFQLLQAQAAELDLSLEVALGGSETEVTIVAGTELIETTRTSVAST